MFWFNEIALHVTAFAYATWIGHVVILWLMDALWDAVRPDHVHRAQDRDRYKAIAGIVGVLERALYAASLVFKKPEFIALWIAMKVVGQWRGWTDTQSGSSQADSAPPVGRTLFNLFLIGNGLSIAFGVVGGASTEWLRARNWRLALIAGLAPIFLGLILRAWGVRIGKALHEENPGRAAGRTN